MRLIGRHPPTPREIWGQLSSWLLVTHLTQHMCSPQSRQVDSDIDKKERFLTSQKLHGKLYVSEHVLFLLQDV